MLWAQADHLMLCLEARQPSWPGAATPASQGNLCSASMNTAARNSPSSALSSPRAPPTTPSLCLHSSQIESSAATGGGGTLAAARGYASDVCRAGSVRRFR
jgi:hypothetical protein